MQRSTDPSPQQLLADTAWVAGLARGLLGDRGEADDAVQQTWLVALERRPHDPARRRAWLAGILRNVVRRRARGESRRRRHETDALRDGSAEVARAAAGSSPATVDLVARAELQRRLAEAVLALDEPLRTTVLLRYFGGLSARRIADQQGVPAVTVRARLHRALARLRRQLAGRDGRGAERWAPALVALAAPARWRPWASAFPTPAAPLGGLVMTTKTQLAAAALVVALIGAATWWIAGSAAPSGDGHEGVPVATTPGGAPVAPVASPAGALPLELPAGADGAGALSEVAIVGGDADEAASAWPGAPVRFTGRVVDELGAPIAGAEVVFVPNLHNLTALKTSLWDELSRWPDDRLARAPTDEQGRYTLDARHLSLAFGERVRTSSINDLAFPEIVAEAPGRGRVARVLRGWDGGDRQLDDIVLGPGGRVIGRAVDEAGRPLAGVEVNQRLSLAAEWSLRSDDVGQKGHAYSFLSSRTGADGRFALEGTTRGGGALVLSLPGYLDTTTERFDLPTRGELDLGDQVLRAGGSVGGRVVDASGRPIAGASVTARQGDTSYYDMGSDTILAETAWRRPWGVQTTATGEFVVEGLAGSTVTVYVDAPGHEPARLTGVAVGAADVVLSLLPQATFEVRVVDDASGALLPEAEVLAWRLTGMPTEGEVALVVRPVPVGGEGGVAPSTKDGGDGATDGGMTTMDGGSATASATAPGGAGALLHVVERPGRVASRLLVRAQGFADAVVELRGLDPPGRAEHEVRLVREATLAGRVLDAAGEPVAGARLTLAPALPERDEPEVPLPARRTHRQAPRDPPAAIAAATRTVESGTDGSFRFDGLCAGPWELDVLARGFVSDAAESRFDLAAGEQRVGDVRLVQAGAAHGTIFDVDGSPLAGESVGMWLREEDGTVGSRHFSTLADEHGRFEVECLPPGSYHIQCDPGGLVDFEVTAGAVTEVEVRRRAYARIEGRTYEARTGKPVPGATLRIAHWWERDGVRHRSYGNAVRSDEEGRFTIEDWPGSYELLAWAPAGPAAPAVPVTLDWGDELLVDVPFAGGRIAGTLVGPDGQPIAGGRVGIDASGMGGVRGVVSDELGAFAFELVAPGSHTLGYSAPELIALEDVRVEVVGDEPVEGLRLPLGLGAELSGSIHLRSGAPVADGTYVQLQSDGHFRRREETDAGRFTFDAVRPGRYELVVGNTAQAEYFENDAWILWREPVTLVAGDVRELEIVLER